jgi:hypothetical protein
MDDFRSGPARLRELFGEVRPWAEAAQARCRAALGGQARISTCFLVDDYFTPFGSPAEIVPMLRHAAEESGLVIDYLARESSCAATGATQPARLVEDRLVAEPPRQTNGSRPPVTETGWLCNGERSPHTGEAGEAMEDRPGWRPPRQTLANNHSIFLDVELWDEVRGERRWSCPMLAAVWQLLRLGLLRDEGRAVARPVPAPDPLPQTWRELPPVIELRRGARPFFAYRTFTAMPSRFLPVEDAVRTILGQVAVERAVTELVLTRAAAEGLALPADVLGRVEYAFFADPWRVTPPESRASTGR